MSKGAAVQPQESLEGILAMTEAAFRQCGSIEAVSRILSAARSMVFDVFRRRFDSAVMAKALTLKLLNLTLAKYHFQARSLRLASRPFGIIVDPSNGCNLACPGCVHSTHARELQLFNWNKGLMPEGRISSFLKRFGPYAIHVNFCNYGEPLLNVETPRYIRQAKGLLAQTMLSTNLSIGQFDAEAYAASGLDYMLVSVDGATQPVYQIFRRNGKLELVFENLAKLVAAKRKLGARTPVIAWRFITFRHNVHEIPLARKKARELGVDQFLTLSPYDVSWDDPEIVAAEVEPVNELLNPQSEASILNNWAAAPDGLDADTIERAFEADWDPVSDTGAGRGESCQWLYRSITLDAGGRIFPCCAAPRPDIDLVFSQFEADGSADVYNSEKYRLARLGFVNPAAYESERGELNPHCIRCDWNKETVNTDAAQIRHYFKAAGGSWIEPKSLDMLSRW